MKKLLCIILVLVMVMTMSGCGLIGGVASRIFKPRSDTPAPETIATQPATVATEPVETEPPAPSVAEDNPYYEYWLSYSDYVLPNSDTVYYGRTDIVEFNDEERELARQEIYARHGNSFTDADLQEYFNARPWYKPGEATELSDCEKANIFLLDTYEKELSGDIYNNRYIRHLANPSTYAMADSNARYLGAADLSNLEHDHLVIIRNEIYARQGRIFDSEALREYFYCTDWYKPNPGYSSKSLNKYEEANISLCKMYEQKLEGVKFSSKNKYKSYYYGPGTQICPESAYQYLSYEYLMMLDDAHLVLIRNEIHARNGYAFTNKDMQEFFLQCDWYKPNTPPGDSSSLELSSVEQANREMVQQVEADRKAAK